MKTVCALIVTYNRKEYLVKLIVDGLLKQTYPINKILIFDNNSTDGTEQELQSAGIIDGYINQNESPYTYDHQKILYYRNAENEGGAGGFHNGIKMASELGCDLIWTMDDDVLPNSSCLERLVANISESARICVPCRTDSKFLDNAILNVNMSNPFLYSIRYRKKTVCSNKIDRDSIEVADMPFEGPLITSSLVKEIGLPRKELFILFDDTEYAYRAIKVTKILYIKTAIMHKQIIPFRDPKRRMGWKEYYSYRNQYWFDRTYGENVFVKYLRPIFNHVDLCLRAIVRRKWSNFAILHKAYHDGTKGILGKTIEPGSI